MSLRLGVARRDVSPTCPVQLAGFGTRGGALVTEIAHPIMLRVALLEDDRGARLALVSGEFLNWSTESDPRLRAIVAEHASVDPDDILFSATHTHSAPQLSHLQAATLGEVDDAYLDDLAIHLADASREASDLVHEVAVSRVVGTHDLARQRRADLDMSVSDAPIVVDDRLTVIRLDAADGLVACFVHYACHPVVSSDLAVSGDYFGAAVAEVERITGAVAFPLQGCAGDVNPPKDLVRAGVDGVTRVGKQLADAALALLAGNPEHLSVAELSSRWCTVDLPLAAVPTRSELEQNLASPGIDAEWAAYFLAHPDRLLPSVECRLQLWSLGSGLQLLAINGEATNAYGLRIRRLSQGTALPVAYSNGIVGYLPTARQIAAGGYEVHQSARMYLLPGTFDPIIEERLDRAIDSLLMER